MVSNINASEAALLPEDVLRRIASYLPPSLNVRLTCQLFREEKDKPLTRVTKDADIDWLYEEAKCTPVRIRHHHHKGLEHTTRELVLEGAAFQGCLKVLRRGRR